jgi:sec-independent protein translocase protein TatB
MFEVGFSEMLLIALVALLVLGPNKLPKLARDVGRWAGRARQMVRQMQDQLDHETRVAEWSLGDPERAKTLNNPPAIPDVSDVPDGPEAPRRPAAAVPTGPEAVQHPAMAAVNVAAGPEAVPPPLAPDSLPTSTVNEHDRPVA